MDPSPLPLNRELPLLERGRPERSDAAQNREALLRSAQELVAERGVAAVTMDDVARRACVGKGTLFRRFGTREGLMGQLLDHSEREWQALVIGGPPPLGPGADPWERLLAFGASRVALNLHHAELIEAAGNPAARSFGALSFTTMHVRYLLEQLGVGGDLPYLATALVAPLEMIVLGQQVGREQVPLERIQAGWEDLVRRVVGSLPERG